MQTALARIRALPFDMEIRVCGFPDFSLLPIDLDLSEIREPQHIVYASIERMFKGLDDYDYFLNIEDDILVADEVIEASIAFNASSTLNEVYLPNRMEPEPMVRSTAWTCWLPRAGMGPCTASFGTQLSVSPIILIPVCFSSVENRCITQLAE